ncbi:MAG: cohesin domain-containing protein [Minisyncoccia bacterium]
MKKNIITLFITSLLFFIASNTFAAQIDITPESNNLKVGQIFEIRVVLNTENESINAVEGAITFPTDLLRLIDIKDGNSIINFWIEKPVLGETGNVTFSGIIPAGGYSGKDGEIISLSFETIKEGTGNIELTNGTALLNDDNSNQANLTINNSNFTISGQLEKKETVSKIEDTEKPESFSPEIANDPNIFNGKYFLVFSTVDKKSGIDHYEILESKLGNYHLSFGKWKNAQSPYLLEDQNLHSSIFIKVIDKNGNDRIEVVSPRNPLVWYKNRSIITDIIILIFFIILSLFVIIKRTIKK